MKDLTKGKPSRLILAFAIPIFMANILQLTYSIVDSENNMTPEVIAVMKMTMLKAGLSMAIIASYTIGPWLVKLVTGTNNPIVIKNATNYLKFDTLFYYVTAVICIVRNAMQGLGEQITPLVSSSLEMVGKIVIAFTLVPLLGYTGVIVAEPIVWFIMVIPLLVKIYNMPVLRKQGHGI